MYNVHMTDVLEGKPPAPPQAPGRGSRGGGGLERVTVNLIPRSSRALQSAHETTGDTKTDTINRALQVYAYLVYLETSGGEIFVQEPGAETRARLKILLLGKRSWPNG